MHSFQLLDSDQQVFQTCQTSPNKVFYIGRGSDCDIHIPDVTANQMVSRRHVAIFHDGDRWMLQHISQTNPTIINERQITKIDETQELHDGDWIQLSIHGPKFQFVTMEEQPPIQRKPKWKKYVLIGVTLLIMVVIAVLLPKDHKVQIEQQLSNNMSAVYHIRVTSLSYSFLGKSEEMDLEEIGWNGTGFCTNDGRFITSRHVVQPWLWIDSERMLLLNMVHSEGGTINATFEAISTQDTFRFSLKDCHFNKDGELKKTKSESWGQYSLTTCKDECFDYTWVYHKNEKGLEFDYEKSKTVEMGETLHILGYPYSIKGNNCEPLYSQAVAAATGLSENGEIVTTNTGFEHGNSGGPVMCEVDGILKVVGIVTSGVGNSTGFVIPISVLK